MRFFKAGLFQVEVLESCHLERYVLEDHGVVFFQTFSALKNCAYANLNFSQFIATNFTIGLRNFPAG